jgi:hypothetical protein
MRVSGPSKGYPKIVLSGTRIFKIIFRLHNKFTHAIFHINSRKLEKLNETQNADTSYFEKKFLFLQKIHKYISFKIKIIIFSRQFQLYLSGQSRTVLR